MENEQKNKEETEKKSSSLKKKMNKAMNLIKLSRKYFIDFRIHLFSRIKNKYNKHYILTSYSKEDIEVIPKEFIPTYYEYYKINNLINKKPCHYYSIFNDISFFLNETEYLNKYFPQIKSSLFIKYSIYNLCYFRPNFFPLGKIILFYLQSFYSKMKAINDMKIKEALLEDNRIVYNASSSNIKSVIQEYSNILKSFVDESKTSTKSFSYSIENKNIKIKKGNDKRNEDSINEITDIVEKISELEKKRNQIEMLKKLQLEALNKKKKEKNLYITNLNLRRPMIKKMNTQKITNKKDFYKLFRRNSTRQIILENKEKEENDDSKKKFKNILDFKTDLSKKEQKTCKKKDVLNSIISQSKNTIIDRGKLNLYNRLKDGYINNVPEIMIGLNDFREDERLKNVFQKNTRYLKKVENYFIKEEKKLKKNSSMKEIVKYPNIYSNYFNHQF